MLILVEHMLRALGCLPASVLLKTNKIISFVLYRFFPKIVHVSKVNIGLCFPELKDEERQQLLVKSFNELGKSLAETLFVWFKDATSYLNGRIQVEGSEFWEAAIEQDKGVILLSCHTGSLDMNLALISQLDRKNRELVCTYRQPSNNKADKFLCSVRQPYADYIFPVGNLLGISRVLKKGGLVWYAPDIETSKKGRVFVKFMNVDAATPAGIARLAESTGAIVLPYMHRRELDNKYCVKFFPPLDLKTNTEIETETQKVNDAIELIVREKPEAYWWTIKRFRYRADGSPSVYET